MKTTFKHISLFALGMVAIALLTSVRLTPATAAMPTTVTLKTLSVPSAILVAGKDDGQESHGDKGKTKGG
ncbi:MAG: hypothetical protein JWL77_3905 [Chthonomonadaceae bacterium]|nr:hypothetical protein [Chthonomonadaceae bacterium]